MINIRPFEPDDWNATWRLLKPVFRAGETYSFATDLQEDDAYRIWIDAPANTYVAVSTSGDIFGTYFIKANQSGNGAHVSNCGYIVGDAARGQGVATLMCEHSQREAVKLGFRAMQYNFVVSSNAGAVRLWEKLGFDIVGTLPQAFNHPAEGYIDVYVMYKQLVE